MLVIFGINFLKDKKISYALPKLYGIGIKSSKRICSELGFTSNLCIKDLTENQEFKLAKKIKDEYRLEGSLREDIQKNIQHYIALGNVRGFRHRNLLPVRGQRTHTNARTVKRNKLKKI
jgi:small subunit ribosomal protein S13